MSLGDKKAACGLSHIYGGGEDAEVGFRFPTAFVAKSVVKQTVTTNELSAF